MKRLVCLLVLLVCSVAVCAGAAAADGVGRSQTRRGTQRKRPAHKPSAPLVPVSLLDGEGFKQLLARGTPPNDRPLLINFWATWCDPCREEFPDLVKIDADYRTRGLDFVALSIDDPTDAATSVPKFLRDMRAQMRAYILNVSDTEPVINAVDRTWGGELPATFLFNRQGQVVFQHKGRINAKELRAALDKVISDR
ncbi:MAG TPA: redoxin domain-containing protein [Pyrinomonadaceae bacterium]|jgi:thiol-disulfide isomerase/thioredoxin|nr:redoxin domain-containing protein [Pyrinomonadaceae bacterium]